MTSRLFFSYSRTLFTSQYKMPKRNGESPEKDSKKAKSILERSATPRIKTASGNEMKIISANVAGLRGLLNSNDKKSKFIKLMNDEKPDIIALQEHKLQEVHVASEGQVMKELFPDYKQYWTCSTQKKGYSGVAILVRSKDPGNPKQKSVKDFFPNGTNGTKKAEAEEKYPSPLNVLYGLGEENEKDLIASKEGRVITVEFDSFFVINTYVPNSGQNLERLDYRLKTWDIALAEYMKRLEKTKPVLLIGDLNVAHDIRDIHNFYPKPWFPNKPEDEDEYKGLKSVASQAGCTKRERDSFSEFLKKGFIDTFRKLHPNASGCFTYWSMRAGNRQYNKGLRLDYVVTSAKMMDDKEEGPKLIDSFILDESPAFSDHCPVGCTVQLK